jgi:hypothetical protein
MFMEQSVREQAEHVPGDDLVCGGEVAEQGTENGPVYRRWITWVWQGKLAKVIA